MMMMMMMLTTTMMVMTTVKIILDSRIIRISDKKNMTMKPHSIAKDGAQGQVL
jgi:hypothetical protein